MAKSMLDLIFTDPFEQSNADYEKVKEFVETVLDKAPHYAVVEELENVAEYVVLLEKLLEENGIDFSDETLQMKKYENTTEIDNQKRLFLLHFSGKIVRKEGAVV
ncbi:DUF2018 family protein [Hippea maritima]|uniref:Uncharacterized protein n=1 Tax=Hippea maritima (strain ATCC 700847 / DSM 10411 / MH2) TaxID=760142 RepID=F2LVR5_HIPMA|nr:DUF2018 family protein [Hippea maritima]AEA33849.1 hypothetical protein Hipma_0879 [Hippea maritima DSM 10411]